MPLLAAEIQTLDVISVNIWDIVISLINLLIMFFIVKRFLFKPVSRVFAERKKKVETVLKEADDARDNAKQERDLYQSKLDNIKNESDELIHSAVEKGNKLSDQILRDAHNQAETIVTKAQSDIALEKKKALNELKDDISTISFDIAEKMIGREITRKDQDELINSFIEEIGDNDD